MSRISTYEVVPVPKLADKLIGTSVGGEIEDVTYNFTLQELLNLFIPLIPANNLQGVLDFGNTAIQDIILFGTITTTNLDVTNTSNLFITYLNSEVHIVGSLFDSNDFVGTAGQVLISTGAGVEWYSLPPIFTPNLQQVLTEGNTSTVDIILTSNLSALDVSSDTATFSTDITIDGTLTDGTASVGTLGKVLSSTVTGVQWVDLPSYSAISPLFFNSGTGVFSIQVANNLQNGYLSSADWINFDGKQPAGNYITALTGEATASGPGSVPITLNNASVIAKVLTGLNVTGGSISATDSILIAFGKVQNQINGLLGGVQYQGVWNAFTNNPVLTSSIGTQGHYYVVNVAGSTNLNGITDWKVGDWAIFSGGVWQKVDNTDAVSSVNGQVGAVSLTTDNIPEGVTNLYFLNSRARTAVSATSPLLYDNLTGVFSIQVANSIQNGYLSSADWIAFNGKQNLLGGTGLVKSTAGTISYITDNSSNWNTAYNDSIVSAAVTGTGTKTLTLTQQDAGTITASWTDLGLTSVALSMPSAFNVANSPLTANGTLAVTAIGLASQYIRGDGTLANFPTDGGGGGSSVSYYLNGSVNQGTFGGNTYYEMSKTPIFGAGTDFNIAANGYIAQFLTDANDPNALLIPAGNWNFETYFSASSGGGSPTFYIELYKFDGVVFTLIASNSATPELISLGTNINPYFSALAVPETVLTATDRLAIRIYVANSGRTITLHTENSHLCQVITTFTTGIQALNGLTKQTQYFAVGTSGTDFNISSVIDTHTFNLPTASATNRGALSSADWIIFNGKQNALTNPVTGTGTTNTLPKFTGASTIGDSAITDDGTTVTLVSRALSGTSATFSSTATASAFIPTSSTIPANGMYLGAANTLNFATNSTNRLTISTTLVTILSALAVTGNFFMTGANVTINGGTNTGSIQYGNGTSSTHLKTYGSTHATLANVIQLTNNNVVSLTLSATGAATFTGALLGTSANFTGQLTLGSTITNGTQTYTLPSATGTLALTSDIPANPVTGTGTTNFLPKFTAASTIGDSLFYDNGTLTAVGNRVSTNSFVGLVRNFNVLGTDAAVRVARYTDNYATLHPTLEMLNYSDDGVYRRFYWDNFVDGNDSYAIRQRLTGGGVTTNGTLIDQVRLMIFSGGNVGIATTTDAGFKLDVNGTGRFSGATNALTLRSTSATTMWTEYYYNTSTLSGYIGSGSGILSGANNSDFIIRSEADFVVATGGNNRRLTISSTGAATFSSGVGINGATLQTGLGAGLTIEGGTYAPLYLSNSGTLRGFLAAYSGGILLSASTGILSLNNGGGSVLIGTTTDAGSVFKLQVKTTGGSNYLRLQTDVGAFDCASQYTDGTDSVFAGMMKGTTGLSGAYTIYTGGASRLTVTSAGYTWVNGAISGFTGSGVQFQVNGQSRMGGTIILHNTSNANQTITLNCTSGEALTAGGSVTAAGFNSYTGTVSAANVTWVTIYTIPSTQAAEGVYYAYGHYNDDSGGMAFTQVLADRSSVRAINASNGATVLIQLSGRNIQVQHSYGVTVDIQYSILWQKLR
jgi:hypothetical protein